MLIYTKELWMEDKYKVYRGGFSSGLIKDFAWYFASSFLPLIVGFLKTPIFTRHFSTESFGSLGIVQITYSYLGMILFSWISSCLWRYYQKFKQENRSDALNGGLIFLASISFLLLLLVSSVLYSTEDDALVKQIILYSFFYLVFNQGLMSYLVMVRLEGKAMTYTIFQSFRAVLGFALSLILVFYLNKDISVLVGSLAVIDAIALLVLLFWNPLRARISMVKINKNDLKTYLSYGSAGLVMNLSLLSLNLSDRYVILHADGLGSVGIYDQVYKIALLSVSALVSVFFNTINPRLFRELESNFNKSIRFMASTLNLFLITGMPVVVYLSLYSEEIASLVLGPGFREAQGIMPFVFIAAFLQGLANFYELRLKFSNRMKLLTLIFLIGAGLNLLLNIILVPRFGYFWAAYTTLISYSIMMLLFHWYDKALFTSLKIYRKNILRFIGILALQSIVFALFKKFEPGSMYMIILGLIFVLSYGWMLKKSGFAINEESIPR